MGEAVIPYTPNKGCPTLHLASLWQKECIGGYVGNWEYPNQPEKVLRRGGEAVTTSTTKTCCSNLDLAILWQKECIEG